MAARTHTLNPLATQRALFGTWTSPTIHPVSLIAVAELLKRVAAVEDGAVATPATKKSTRAPMILRTTNRLLRPRPHEP
jgi:hypothetical protein